MLLKQNFYLNQRYTYVVSFLLLKKIQDAELVLFIGSSKLSDIWGT